MAVMAMKGYFLLHRVLELDALLESYWGRRYLRNTLTFLKWPYIKFDLVSSRINSSYPGSCLSRLIYVLYSITRYIIHTKIQLKNHPTYMRFAYRPSGGGDAADF